MLKKIATARSECTRNESMASYNTDYTVPDLTEFFDDDCTMIRKRFVFVKNIILTKNWFVVRIFHEYPEYNMEK